MIGKDRGAFACGLFLVMILEQAFYLLQNLCNFACVRTRRVVRFIHVYKTE